MITAEEILKEYMSSDSAYVHYDDCIGAMNDYAKFYANQKLDEAAESAFNHYKASGMTNLAERTKQSILSLKDEI